MHRGRKPRSLGQNRTVSFLSDPTMAASSSSRSSDAPPSTVWSHASDLDIRPTRHHTYGISVAERCTSLPRIRCRREEKSGSRTRLKVGVRLGLSAEAYLVLLAPISGTRQARHIKDLNLDPQLGMSSELNLDALKYFLQTPHSGPL
jgi:hypothetical protein